MDRRCRIAYRNFKVKEEKITPCDHHALMDILCAWFCFSNKHTGLCYNHSICCIDGVSVLRILKSGKALHQLVLVYASTNRNHLATTVPPN